MNASSFTPFTLLLTIPPQQLRYFCLVFRVWAVNDIPTKTVDHLAYKTVSPSLSFFLGNDGGWNDRNASSWGRLSSSKSKLYIKVLRFWCPIFYTQQYSILYFCWSSKEGRRLKNWKDDDFQVVSSLSILDLHLFSSFAFYLHTHATSSPLHSSQ